MNERENAIKFVDGSTVLGKKALQNHGERFRRWLGQEVVVDTDSAQITAHDIVTVRITLAKDANNPRATTERVSLKMLIGLSDEETLEMTKIAELQAAEQAEADRETAAALQMAVASKKKGGSASVVTPRLEPAELATAS